MDVSVRVRRFGLTRVLNEKPWIDVGKNVKLPCRLPKIIKGSQSVVDR